MPIPISELMDLLSERTLAAKVVIPCKRARDLVRDRPLLHSSFLIYRHDCIFGMQVIMGSVLGGVEIPEAIAEKELIDLLARERTSIEDFYPEAATGAAGGMSQFWDTVISAYIKSLSQSWFSHVLETHIDPYNYEYIQELLTEFVERYGSIISPHVHLRPIPALMANWKEFLISSARLISQFESQLRTP